MRARSRFLKNYPEIANSLKTAAAATKAEKLLDANKAAMNAKGGIYRAYIRTLENLPEVQSAPSPERARAGSLLGRGARRHARSQNRPGQGHRHLRGGRRPDQ